MTSVLSISLTAETFVFNEDAVFVSSGFNYVCVDKGRACTVAGARWDINLASQTHGNTIPRLVNYYGLTTNKATFPSSSVYITTSFCFSLLLSDYISLQV